MTAAHCVKSSYEIDMEVGVGSDRIENLKFHEVKRIFIHEKYWSCNKDIAIIELKYPLKFTEKIQPIQLPDHNESIDDATMMTVSGWGFSRDIWSMSKKLQFVEIPIVNHDKCTEILSFIYKWQICAGYLKDEGRNGCYGDSGGPLSANNVIYGVVSMGPRSCSEKNFPAIYTNIIYFRDWINEITGL